MFVRNRSPFLPVLSRGVVFTSTPLGWTRGPGGRELEARRSSPAKASIKFVRATHSALTTSSK